MMLAWCDEHRTSLLLTLPPAASLSLRWSEPWHSPGSLGAACCELFYQAGIKRLRGGKRLGTEIKPNPDNLLTFIIATVSHTHLELRGRLQADQRPHDRWRFNARWRNGHLAPIKMPLLIYIYIYIHAILAPQRAYSNACTAHVSISPSPGCKMSRFTRV